MDWTFFLPGGALALGVWLTMRISKWADPSATKEGLRTRAWRG